MVIRLLLTWTRRIRNPLMGCGLRKRLSFDNDTALLHRRTVRLIGPAAGEETDEKYRGQANAISPDSEMGVRRCRNPIAKLHEIQSGICGPYISY